MNSTLAKLADALVGVLNDKDFSQPFVAEWSFVPVHTLKELQVLCVTVVPRLQGQQTAARNLIAEQLTMDIALQRHVETDPDDPMARETQVDQILALADEIARELAMQAIVVGQVRYQWQSCQRVPLLQDQLLEEHVATSVVSVTYHTTSAPRQVT